jgi:hypothetical protein
MKPSRRLRSKSLLILLIFVLATPFASAKPAPFIPSPGSYSGTSTTLGQNFETKGGVHIHKGNVSLNVSIRALLSCPDSSTLTLDQGFVVKPKGKTFGIKASGANEVSIGFYHYDLSGRFTSKSAFSGTLTVKGNSEAGNCSGVSQFSLKKG